MMAAPRQIPISQVRLDGLFRADPQKCAVPQAVLAPRLTEGGAPHDRRCPTHRWRLHSHDMPCSIF